MEEHPGLAQRVLIQTSAMDVDEDDDFLDYAYDEEFIPSQGDEYDPETGLDGEYFGPEAFAAAGEGDDESDASDNDAGNRSTIAMKAALANTLDDIDDQEEIDGGTH